MKGRANDKKTESNGASQTPSEQIEQWAYVGMIVERQLTGQEQLQLMTGEAVVSFKTNTNKEGEKRR